jgi:uncharacterized membrane protein required for colicin V production
MNWIDIILVIIVLLAVWNGWKEGFILEILSLINWLGSLILGFIFYPYLIPYLTKLFPGLTVWRLPLAFIITALIARVLIGLITRRIAVATSAYTNENVINKSLGIIPGFINGVIFAAILAALLLALPLMDGINKAVRESLLANKLSAKTEWVNEKLSPVFDKAIHQTMNDLTIHPKSDESVKLTFKISHPGVYYSLGIKIISLVNKERNEIGL